MLTLVRHFLRWKPWTEIGRGKHPGQFLQNSHRHPANWDQIDVLLLWDITSEMRVLLYPFFSEGSTRWFLQETENYSGLWSTSHLRISRRRFSSSGSKQLSSGFIVILIRFLELRWKMGWSDTGKTLSLVGTHTDSSIYSENYCSIHLDNMNIFTCVVIQENSHLYTLCPVQVH